MHVSSIQRLINPISCPLFVCFPSFCLGRRLIYITAMIDYLKRAQAQCTEWEQQGVAEQLIAKFLPQLATAPSPSADEAPATGADSTSVKRSSTKRRSSKRSSSKRSSTKRSSKKA
jgi:hypothetical protein